MRFLVELSRSRRRGRHVCVRVRPQHNHTNHCIDAGGREIWGERRAVNNKLDPSTRVSSGGGGGAHVCNFLSRPRARANAFRLSMPTERPLVVLFLFLLSLARHNARSGEPVRLSSFNFPPQACGLSCQHTLLRACAKSASTKKILHRRRHATNSHTHTNRSVSMNFYLRARKCRLGMQIGLSEEVSQRVK